MDQISAINANRLLGNEDDAIVIEMMYSGPQLLVHEPCTVALRGGNFRCIIDGKEVDSSKPIPLYKGNQIQFRTGTTGMFGYLAVRGGVKSDKVLGSGTSLSGYTGKSRLKKGDMLEANDEKISKVDQNKEVIDTDYNTSSIAVYPGPEYEAFAHKLPDLETMTWTVSNSSNRMSYQMEELLSKEASGILTAPVQAGTVQLTPSGRLVVLMRDCQTTGGYARILQLTDRAVSQLAQKRPGSRINFSLKL
ncbi:hypothetical protein BST85_04050 [Aureitalea marina]|uniref:Carboxyltransferase domain-containing protein n=2 Tax=Aureitalea marina TaxID=930804 RepID=A0A2S7KNH2_9FLAO|nr:hypothetical protein BST85_04050 [Aureitalea marina]